MDLNEELPDSEPNVPLVAVRGVTDKDAWKLYERYNIEFTPPTGAERKLCEVILALEELVADFVRSEERRRRPKESE